MKTKGFTIIEIIVALAILIFLGVLTFSVFNRYKRDRSLDVNSQILVGTLNEARSKTLDSLEGSQYGVHLASSSVTLFKGLTYNPSDPLNQERSFQGPVVIASTTLPGPDVVFERLSGETEQYGSIFLSVPNRTGETAEIIVEQTGVSYD